MSLLFADDTTLVLSHDNLDTLINNTNVEFKKVCDYFRANRLVLHPAKTKYIVFTRSRRTDPPVLFCNNNNDNQTLTANISIINEVTSNDKIPAIKFLGVFIDPNLNFKFHINSLRQKLSKALYSLRTVKNILSP